MKRLFIFLLAAGFLSASCNNNNKKDPMNINHEKDDYRNNKNNGDDDNGKTNYNDNDDNNNNGGGKWSSSDQNKFMDVCLAETNKQGISEDVGRRVCSCTLDKVADRYSSYAAADRGDANLIASDMKECAADAINSGSNSNSNKDNDDNGGGSWSSSDQNKFMKVCMDEVEGQGVSGSIARKVCSCTLEKVSNRYGSYAEADRGNANLIANDMKECAMEVKNNGGQE